jgi:hypothetical protein
LLSWPLGVTAFNILFAPHHAPRYYYPAYAAVPLLLIRSLYRAGEPTPGVRRAVWGSVAAQTLVALLLVASDKSFARASRALAERLADARGRSIAYVGHWGFQYYAQQHPRLHPLDVRQPPPPAGSLVAIVGDTFAGEYPAWLQNPNPAAEPGVFETAYSGAEPRSVHFRPVEPRSSTPHPWPLITVGLIDGVQLHASGGQDAWLLPYARRTAPFFLVLVLERIP